MPYSPLNFRLRQFVHQRNRAKHRGIDFDLTFEEWLSIWTLSGKLSQRGRRPDEYVMARFGDRGPYAVGNVHIITGLQNIHDRQFTRSSLAKIVAAHLGKPVSAETRRKISASSKGRKLSAERCAQIAETNRMRPPISDDTRAKMRASAIGKTRGPRSSEDRKKISEALKKRHREAAACPLL